MKLPRLIRFSSARNPRLRRPKAPSRLIESLEQRALMAGDFASAVGLAGAAEANTSPAAAVAEQIPTRRDTDLISDAQKENIKTLIVDLQAIAADSEVTSEQVQQLVTDVMEVADGATAPDEALVQTLHDDFAAAMEDGDLSVVEIAQLKSDFTAVLESAGVTTEEIDAVVTDLQGIVESSNVDQQDVQTIVNDLVAIVDEFQNRDPLVSDAQKENLATLASDLQDIAAHTTITPELVAQIRADLQAIAESATRPDRESVVELLRDIRSARKDGVITEEEKLEIGESFDAVLDSANISEEARAELWADIAATGLTRVDIQTIAGDVEAIRKEFRDNHPLPTPRPRRR